MWRFPRVVEIFRILDLQQNDHHKSTQLKVKSTDMASNHSRARNILLYIGGAVITTWVVKKMIPISLSLQFYGHSRFLSSLSES